MHPFRHKSTFSFWDSLQHSLSVFERFNIARNILKKIVKATLVNIENGSLEVQFPDGEYLKFVGHGQNDIRAQVHIHDWKALGRLFMAGNVGFAQAYIEGYWSSPDLDKFMGFVLANEQALHKSLKGNLLSQIALRFGHARNANTINGSKRNISYHYDLGNAFYQCWLDPSMTYSSGMFMTDDTALEVAQQEKYHQICELAGIERSDRVLEIGCGWGGFMEVAAGQYDCDVTGLTLSSEQCLFARNRLISKGLSGRCHVEMRDYRHQEGVFDKIVSIEMFEAVGEENWTVYFDKIRRLLAPGGRAVLQVITIDADRFDRYRKNADFIQRFIFPGGMLPSVDAFKTGVKSVGLDLKYTKFFGHSYALTLREWQKRFQRAWPEIQAQGFDRKFKRMWEYYLSYCEAGFIHGSIDVGLFVLEKEQA